MFRKLVIFAFVVVVLLAQLPQAIGTIRSWFRQAGDSWLQQDAVTSTERAKELAAKGLRGQLVSFGDGMESLYKDETTRSLDERYDLYAIPVGQISLDSAEAIEKVVVTGTSSRFRPENVEGSRYAAAPPYATSGKYSNILLFDLKTGKFQKLFDGRVSISQYQRGWNTKPEILVVFAADRDSDANGTMDDNDLHDVYILTLSDKVLHKVANMSTNPSELINVPNVDYIIVKAKIDHDRDGHAPQFGYGPYDDNGQQNPEPDMLFRIDLKTFIATPFVPEPLVQELQKTLDAVPEKTPSPSQK